MLNEPSLNHFKLITFTIKFTKDNMLSLTNRTEIIYIYIYIKLHILSGIVAIEI